MCPAPAFNYSPINRLLSLRLPRLRMQRQIERLPRPSVITRDQCMASQHEGPRSLHAASIRGDTPAGRGGDSLQLIGVVEQGCTR